jgi:integrase/recombinase XerD
MSIVERVDQLEPTGGLGALTDPWHAAELWFTALRLRRPVVSEETMKNYRREVNRLRWYCETFDIALPNNWSIQDLSQYLTFLRERTQDFVSPSTKASDLGWTPFKGRLAESSVANCQKVLHALYRFWMHVGYVSRTPFAGVGGGSTRQASAGARRAVQSSLVDYVIDAMDQRDKSGRVEHLTYLRNRFVIRLLEKTGLRADEAAAANMGHVQPFSDVKTGRVHWSIWIEKGKGGTQGRVPVTDSVMHDFRVYRLAYGLPEAPQNHETQALILSPYTRRAVGDRIASAKDRRYFGMWGEIRNRGRIWDIVTKEFRAAAVLLDGEGRSADADQIRNVSPHWLRHTAATTLVLQGVDLRMVAKALRHRDIRTTMGYTDPDFLDLARAISDVGK